MNKAFSKSLLSASAIALLIASPSFAQTKEKKTEPEKVEKKSDSPSDTVVVTGSRIRRDSFNQASPLQVITMQNATLAGQSDGSRIIQGSTSAASSTQINNMFSGFIVEGGPGIQTVGLNSLGSQRTLVMLNGHRLPPSGVRGQVGMVDLQNIPTLAISRFDILNEGASPIYGSDAVGGVVNGITRKDVNGFEVQATGNTTVEGGGSFYKVGALWGKTGDNWNALVAAEYREQTALKISDRDFCMEDYVFNPTTGERLDFINPKTGQYYCLGVNGTSFNRVSLGGTAATGTGTWVLDPTSTTTVIGTNPQTGAGNTKLKVPGFKRLFSPPVGTVGVGNPIAYQLDYNHPLYDDSDLISPSKVSNLYTSLSHDLPILGGATVYAEGLYSKRESTQTRGAQLFFAIPASNVYNPFGVTATPVIARPANNEQTVDTWQILAGIKGHTNAGIFGLLKNGDWDVYGQTSEGKGKYSSTTIRADRVAASLATTITGGVASCPTPVYGGSCLPINFFDPRVITGNYTQAEYDYLFGAPNEGTTIYKQTLFEANLSGDLFKIPGARDEIKANFGIQYRKYSIDDTPGTETLRQNTLLSTSAGITRGEDAAKEFYTEISMPLIAKKPLIEDLNWTVAYRYTNYDSYDANSTWKSTVQWRITPEIQLVAISGTSYRAPSLYELFLGNQTGFLSQGSVDPCINWALSSNTTLQTRCAAEGIPNDYTGSNLGGGSSATIYTGGGAGNLTEETSRSDIFSIIYTPTFADLRLRLDFWKINVEDQIANFGAANIVNSCYTDLTGKAAYFCGLFTRDATTKNILTVKNNYVNINVQEVKGIDFKALYSKEFNFGKLTIDSQHRWTTQDNQGLFSDSELFNYAGTIGEPIYNSQTQLRFSKQDWTYAWTINAIGPASDVRYYGTDTFAIAAGSNFTYQGVTSVKYKLKTETTITHNFTVQYKNDNWTLLGGVTNIFDEPPPAVSTGIGWSKLGNMPLTSQYYDSMIGRSVFVNVTKRF